MYAGGSGLYLTEHVKFIVLPLSTWISGDPSIFAVGTETIEREKEKKKKETFLNYKCKWQIKWKHFKKEEYKLIYLDIGQYKKLTF